MAPSREPPEPDDNSNDRLKMALQTHSIETVRFLVLAKEELGDSAYSDLVRAVRRIVKQSVNPDGGITVGKCEEILSEVFVGRTRLLNGFHHILQARDPFHDELPLDPISFLQKLKASPHISDEEYKDFLTTMSQFTVAHTMTVEDVYEKAKRIMRNCPEILEIFRTFLPPRLQGPLLIEQPRGTRKPSPIGKMEATNISNNVAQLEHLRNQNHDLTEYPVGQKHRQQIPDSRKICINKGNGESLYAEEYEGDKIDPLPDWSPSRENELPPKVDLNICTPCTPSYCRLPEDCLTLQSSYWTEMGRSIFNDAMVSVASGTEDCFKFRTKNQYEENIIKCEDDMFESDMLLQRFRATAEFIGNLQDRVDNDIKIVEHLTPLHRRCIEQLYDDYGLDVLDFLSETQNTSATLAVLHSRLNQKIEVLSVARLSLHKACSGFIANNYYRSLDYRSPSFKQLDAKRMTPKALLSEAKEINMKSLITGVKHLSSCKDPYRFVSDDVHHSTDLNIHEDIYSIVSYASHKKNSSEHKPVMIWTKLVQSFVSGNCQLQELNCTVAPKEACERCGLSKRILGSILNALLAENFPLSSKIGECLGNASNNKSTSIHDSGKVEIEEGEFIPCIENIQMDTMLGPVNGAASYVVASLSGDGSSFQQPEHSICDNHNKTEVQRESREGSNVQMGSLAYSKTVTELHDLKGAKTCCSMVVLCRLHQMLYERLLVAKALSREANAKALLRGSPTSDLYAKFKGKLFKLLNGSTGNSNFEEYCLNFLGPKSYVLFTLDKLIWQVVNQLRGLCDDNNLLLQLNHKTKRLNLSEDLLHHHNARSSPARASNGPVEQDPEEGDEGSRLHKDTVKPAQNHFHRRKKHRLENSPASLPQPSVNNSNS